MSGVGLYRPKMMAVGDLIVAKSKIDAANELMGDITRADRPHIAYYRSCTARKNLREAIRALDDFEHYAAQDMEALDELDEQSRPT